MAGSPVGGRYMALKGVGFVGSAMVDDIWLHVSEGE